MTTHDKIKLEVAEIEALLNRQPAYGSHSPREASIMQDLAKIGAHILTASALDYNGDGLASMDQEIGHAAHNQGWLNPHSSDNLPYYLALAEALKLDPADYGVEPGELTFHDQARTPEERDKLKQDLNYDWQAVLAAEGFSYNDRLEALERFTETLMQYAGVEA